MLFARYQIFFDALKSAVSTCSSPDCGQIWGQKRFLTRGGRCLPIPAGKRFLCARLLEFQQLLSGIYCRPLIPNLWIIIRFSAAHPAGTVNLALGKSSGGATRPRGDKLFASKLAEDSLLTMDCAHALFTVVTAISVQLYSLLDSSGRLQESSRKHALLQATYLPRRKSVIPHHFNPFCFGYCTSAGAEMQGVFPSQAYHFLPRDKQRIRPWAKSVSRQGWPAGSRFKFGILPLGGDAGPLAGKGKAIFHNGANPHCQQFGAVGAVIDLL